MFFAIQCSVVCAPFKNLWSFETAQSILREAKVHTSKYMAREINYIRGQPWSFKGSHLIGILSCAMMLIVRISDGRVLGSTWVCSG